MLEETPLSFIILPLTVVSFLFLYINKSRIEKRDISSKKKSVELFKSMTLVFGVTCVVLYLCLPTTPSLSTFGYPEDIEAINSNQRILNLLQTYNKAIVRTTSVLSWFLFFFVFWFISTLFIVLNKFGKED